MASLWPQAAPARDDEHAIGFLRKIISQNPRRGAVHLVLRGTIFQIKVREALVHTELGKVVSYRQLARQDGMPKAQQVVGSALAANTIGFLIPCHRVIRGSGCVGRYRWGPERKLVLLRWEACSLP